jgi:ribosome-binding factor A
MREREPRPAGGLPHRPIHNANEFAPPVMTSRRAQKLAEAVREVVGMAILAEIKDPRVQGVTVTHVEMSGDLRYANVHVSVMGNDTQQNLTLRGLQSAAGFLQSKIAKRIDTRYTPRLEFHLDQGVKKSIEVARILREVLPPEPPVSDDDEPAEEEGEMLEGDAPASDAPEPEDVSEASGNATRLAEPPDGESPAAP